MGALYFLQSVLSLVVASLLLLSASPGWAAISGSEIKRKIQFKSYREPVEKVVDQRVESAVTDYMKKRYYRQEANSGATVIYDGGNDCPHPNPNACVDFVCNKLGPFGCDEADEITRVLKTCRGNFSSRCIEYVCDKLGAFGCDELSEVSRVANACRGNYDENCVRSVCRRLGSFGCDELDEVIAVARSCGGH